MTNIFDDNFDIKSIKNDLERDGYVVIPDFLDQDEITEFNNACQLI